MMYKIVQKKNHKAVYALFTSKQRAEQWLKRHYNSKLWMDKSVTVDDLEILEVDDER